MVELLLANCCWVSGAARYGANGYWVSGVARYGAQTGQTRYGIQPIHLAAEAGSKEVLAALIAAGADVNCVDRDGRQPLHYIFSSRDLPEVIEYLVVRGANVDGPYDSREPTPVYLACEKDFAGNLETLLSHVALADKSPRHQRNSALDTAIEHNSPLCVKVLLRHGINPNCCRLDGGTGLHTFALGFYDSVTASRDKAKDEVVLRLLLDQVDLLAKDKCGHTVLDSLISLGAKRNALTRTVLASLFLKNLPVHKALEKDRLKLAIKNYIYIEKFDDLFVLRF